MLDKIERNCNDLLEYFMQEYEENCENLESSTESLLNFYCSTIDFNILDYNYNITLSPKGCFNLRFKIENHKFVIEFENHNKINFLQYKIDEGILSNSDELIVEKTFDNLEELKKFLPKRS